ncbi:MAG: thioredoxin domain-containing protein [Nocardioides sp.]|nr:thioredoxin domain-containing protein [Nocardioides sp.]
MPETAHRKNLILPLTVAVLAAAVLVAALVGRPDDGTAQDGEAPASVTAGESGPDSAPDPLADLPRRDADDPVAKGSPDAPVVLVVYSEFQCPFCGKFARDTAPALEERYVADGTLRIEWRDFPYLGPESTTAALAGRAAAAQDRFWEFHDAMYADQLPPNSGGLDADHVEAVARDLGLDVERFRDDMAAGRTRDLVADDFEEGRQIGVTGTPSFVINGTPVVGAQPLEVFEQVIEDAAAGS